MARFFTLFSIAVIALAGFAQATESQQGSADGQVGRSGQDGNIQINSVLPDKRSLLGSSKEGSAKEGGAGGKQITGYVSMKKRDTIAKDSEPVARFVKREQDVVD